MNDRREIYLREMATRLRHLPEIDRLEEMAEITQHLDTLIAACQTEGKSPSDAVEEAITRFGAARDIGNRLYQTGKHKRFAPLIEVGLFSAAFSTLFLLTEQIGKGAILSVSSPVVAQSAGMQIIHWPLAIWPVSWIIGIAALAVLVRQYGTRGVARKALGATPTGAAIRWMFWARVASGVPPLFFLLSGTNAPSFSGGATFPHLAHNQQTMVIVVGNAVSLCTAFIVAYFIGRNSNVRESVADAVGCAAAVGASVGLLQMLLQFLPTPWSRPVQPAPFLYDVSGYLMSFLTVGVLGVLRIFAAHSGVQLGEKSRRTVPAAKAA